MKTPTELELEILKVLWERSPLTVREVQEGLASGGVGRELAHTSVITMLHIMVRKKLLRSKKDGKSYLFWPKVYARHGYRKVRFIPGGFLEWRLIMRAKETDTAKK